MQMTMIKQKRGIFKFAQFAILIPSSWNDTPNSWNVESLLRLVHPREESQSGKYIITIIRAGIRILYLCSRHTASHENLKTCQIFAKCRCNGGVNFTGPWTQRKKRDSLTIRKRIVEKHTHQQKGKREAHHSTGKERKWLNLRTLIKSIFQCFP